jgi:hypothetical protein
MDYIVMGNFFNQKIIPYFFVFLGLSFTFYFIFSFFASFSTLAQSNTIATPTPTGRPQGWRCPAHIYCLNNNTDCTIPSGHRVRLSVDRRDPKNFLTPNQETYLVECLGYEREGSLRYICTTGDPNIDATINFKICNDQGQCRTNFDVVTSEKCYSLQKDSQYGIFMIDKNSGNAIRIGSNKYTSVNSTSLKIEPGGQTVDTWEWQSFVADPREDCRIGSHGSEHKFYFYQLFNVPPETDVGQGGQQQATSFDWISGDKDCASINWDPFGRVFDALTLEPVPMAAVFLEKKKDDLYIDAGIEELGIMNPYITDGRGFYSFLVKPGTYRLRINNAERLGYQISTSLSDIHPNYTQVYYHLGGKTYIYPAQTGSEIIEEAGKIEKRDIPLSPRDGVGRRYPLRIIGAFNYVEKDTGAMVVEGSLSHPFTYVYVYGVTSDGQKKLVYKGQADNFGRFNFRFPQREGGTRYSYFENEYQKADLTSLNNGQFAPMTDKKTIVIEPIPVYLEGIAYGTNKQPLANKTINILRDGVGRPYATVKTNNEGYFRVASDQLPIHPYKISYRDLDQKEKAISISTFLTDNQDLLNKKKIDLYSPHDKEGKTLAVKAKAPRPSLVSKNETGESLTPGQDRSSDKTISVSSPVIMILAVILLLTALVVLIVFVYFRQKRNSIEL